MWLLFLNFLLATNVECGDLENAPEFTDYRGEGRLVFPRAWDEQAIIPSYRITRSGKVVFWAAYVHSLFGLNTDYSIEFQVWRAVGGDCYTLVNASTMPPTRPYNHQVNLTLTEHQQFNVEADDVIGYLQTEDGKGVQVLRGVGNYFSLENVSLSGSLQKNVFRVKRNDGVVLMSSATVQGSPVITLSVRQADGNTTSEERNSTTDENNSTIKENNVAALVVGIVVPIVLVVVIVSITAVVCYEMAGRRGWWCLIRRREVAYSSSGAVTYNRPEGSYHSHTDTPTTTTDSTTHHGEMSGRSHELTSSYVDPVDTLMTQDLLGPEEYLIPTGPNYEEPNSFPGNSRSSTHKCKQYCAGYSAVFQRAGTYVPTLEERTFIDGRYEVQNPVKSKNQYNKLCFFPEDKVYWTPATTASGLYAQLSAKKYREIPREQLRILEKIGSGHFATICKGLWIYENESMFVAVKKLRENASESDCVKFLQEAAIMGQFWHPGVITLHGVVTVGNPSLIVMEYAPNGDLLKHLKNIRVCTSKGDRENHAELQKQFLGFARDIASAMVYLAGKKFVHRDLAARNILLDAHMKCRIADFGLTRHLAENGYYDCGRGQVPVKWTAPEALLYQRHSSASDVWSFGMVLYEMWALGLPPFRNTSNEEILSIHNRRGYCLPPPPGTPRGIYSLMVKCWHPEPRQRVTFQQLYQRLSQPEDYLLSWSEEEELSDQARQLGADHTHSHNLYNDLQNTYQRFYYE